MIARTTLMALFGALVALPIAAHACAVGFKPETSGFVLNPILNRLTVSSSKSQKAGDICLLRVNDEILQVNTQLVPGARALAVMRYWKSIPEGAATTFMVRRNGAVLKITTK